MLKPQVSWQHLGPALLRGGPGSPDESVTGDPCIVWDEKADAWRMFYFGQRHERGMEKNCVMQALSDGRDGVGPGQWRKCGPIEYVNPEALPGDAHKPYLLMDAHRPNHAAVVGGLYHLFVVIWQDGRKHVYRAKAPLLKGPWRFDAAPVITPGEGAAFDAYHQDTVTAFYFPERAGTLLYYKGYPLLPQADTPASPYGSRTAAAWLPDGQPVAEKLNQVLLPGDLSTWYGGWTAGLQLIPADGGGWWALMNASPTPPAPVSQEPNMREPAPSLGGFAYTLEAFPVSGWHFSPEPITTIEALPPEAAAMGEGVNLWRHHLLFTKGYAYLFYNSGSYGNEQMFVRRAAYAHA